MRNPIRVRYFGWLAALLFAFFLINSLVLLGINLPQIMARGPDWQEELAEWAAVSLTGLVLLPLLLLAAWRLSRHMLSPLRRIIDSANQIEAGRFDARIVIPDTHDEIALLAESLNRALDRYAAAVAQQQRFAGVASHQLRTPLTVIRSLGEVALQKDRDPPAYRETIADILEESARLAHVIEQLMIMARLNIDALQRTFAPVPVRTLCETVTELFRALYEERGIKVTLDCGDIPDLSGHLILLEQALANVLDNAIRHSPDGGDINLRASSVDTHRVALSVCDSGPGFLFSDLPPDRCGQVPRPHDHTHGLGLKIVEEIVRIHGGTLALGSSPTGGALVTLQIPAAQALYSGGGMSH